MPSSNTHNGMHNSMHLCHDRHGFTLIELMVALVIGAGLLLSGRLLLEQITGAAHVIAAETAAQDTAMTRWRVLRSLVRNLEVGTDSLTTFGGNEHLTQFSSWCIDSTAQRTRCTVRLTVDTVLTAATSATSTSTSTAPPMVLQRTTPGGQFRYLADARDGGQWYRTWGVSITVPLAIGVIVGNDTTVLRIGERE